MRSSSSCSLERPSSRAAAVSRAAAALAASSRSERRTTARRGIDRGPLKPTIAIASGAAKACIAISPRVWCDPGLVEAEVAKYLYADLWAGAGDAGEAKDGEKGGGGCCEIL